MKKILLFTTMALTLVVSAFCFSFVKVNADSDLDDGLFNGADIYSWSVNNVSDTSSVVSYYQFVYYDAQNWQYNGNITFSNDKPVLNSMNFTFHSLQVPFYYSLIIPKFNITTGFTLVYNSINQNSSLVVGVLYSDNTFEQFTTNGYITYFPVETKEIKAIGYLSDTENLYATTIFTGENDKLNSNLYYQGFNEGYNDGYSVGVSDTNAYYEGQINILNNTIAGLQAQIDSLNSNNVNLTFKDTLNNILSYPVKLIRRVFYNDQPVLDELGNPVVDAYGNVQYETTTPIELFGVSLPGLVLGLFAIAMTFGLVAIVKKVWR